MYIIVAIITINITMMIRLGYKVWALSRIDMISKQMKEIRCENREQRLRYVSLVNKRFRMVNRYERLIGGNH